MITRVRAPKGFRFKIGREDSGCTCAICVKERKHNRVVRLMTGGKEIGHINLIRIRKNVYATHSWLSDVYRNRGLGALMYSKAIQWCHDHGHKVRSSGSSSGDATRVWTGKTIRKFFRIRARDNSWSSVTYYAYPKQA